MMILASSSSRRYQLLKRFSPSVRTISSSYEETVPQGLSPQETVCAIAREKLENVMREHHIHQEDIVIAADTMVFRENQAIGKPRDEKDAFLMLKSLSGKEHIVCTALAVHCNGVTRVESETTRVKFAPIDDAMLWAYIATGEPMDKAGGYGIQGLGSIFVEGIHGDYYNVVGLPLHRLQHMMEQFHASLLPNTGNEVTHG